MSEARTPALERAGIAATYELIRPHVRMTPVVEADGADFGLAAFGVRFKLELLQHAGSFKSRGAFANLLLRDSPAAGRDRGLGRQSRRRRRLCGEDSVACGRGSSCPASPRRPSGR